MRLSLALISCVILSETAFAVEIDAEYYFEVGERLLQNGSYEEAIVSFQSSIAENRTYWNAWYGLGVAFYFIREFKDGLDLCNQVLSDSESPQGMNRSRFLVLDGNFKKAYWDENNETPIKDPQSGLCSGAIPDDYQKAMKRYEEALLLNPNSTIAWNSKGIALGSMCQNDRSIACFSEALSIDPALAEVWNNKGVSFDRMVEKHNDSMDCYNKAIELKPQLAVAWMNRAITLSRDSSLTSLALENASWATKLDPSLEDDMKLPIWRYIPLF